MSLLFRLASAQLHFAFHNQSLYAVVGKQWGDRGIHTLFNLHSLLSSGLYVPDCFGTVAQIRDDLPWNHTFANGRRLSNEFGSDFAFWRAPGDKRTILWPDFDYDGWTFAWIPPLSLVADQFRQEMNQWSRRDPRVFFTGKLSARPGHIRARFRDCSDSHPDQFLTEVTEWGKLRKQEGLYRNLSLSSGANSSSLGLLPQWAKPIKGDLRRLLNFKFLIYLEGNTWSTSLKRILVAGAVVLLPLPDPHESFTMKKIMEGCQDCFLYYNRTELSSGNCSSLLQLIRRHDSLQLEQMRDRLYEHVTAFIQDRSKLQRIQIEALSISRDQRPLPSGSAIMAGNDTLEINGVRLDLITCHVLKRMLRDKVGALLQWQINYWFDNECKVRTSAPYLSSVAI